jgi:hypothetical protein
MEDKVVRLNVTIAQRANRYVYARDLRPLETLMSLIPASDTQRPAPPAASVAPRAVHRVGGVD